MKAFGTTVLSAQSGDHTAQHVSATLTVTPGMTSAQTKTWMMGTSGTRETVGRSG